MSLPRPYYQDDWSTVYCGDCREILPQLDKAGIGAVVTDPPYGISYVPDYTVAQSTPWFGERIAGDEDLEVRDMMVAWAGSMPMLVFGSWKMRMPAETRAVLIWDKGPMTGMGDLRFPWKLSWECVYVLGKGFTNNHRDEGIIKGFSGVIQAPGEISSRTGQRYHPTQKPVALMRYLIQRCPAGSILDPFMGAGSTLRAAKDLGRKSVGIEMREDYCEIAVRRLAQEALPLNAPEAEVKQLVLAW